MSSYKNRRSRKSMYHPGISLSHPITYNQKKGMIVQRDTNLPQPGHVYSRKELEKMYRVLLNFHMIPNSFDSIRLDYIYLSIPSGETTSFVINSELVIANSSIVSGQPYFVTSFSLVDQDGSYLHIPSVSYVLNYSPIETFSVQPTRNENFSRIVASLEFGCPFHSYGEYMNFPQQHVGISSDTYCYTSRELFSVSGSSNLGVVPWNDYLNQSTTNVYITAPSETSNVWKFAILVSYVVNN